MKAKLLMTAMTLFVMSSSILADDYKDGAERPCPELKRATCDPFWDYKRVLNGKDKCLFNGKPGKYTVPKDTSGIFGDPSNYGWDLVIDHEETGRDYWCK